MQYRLFEPIYVTEQWTIAYISFCRPQYVYKLPCTEELVSDMDDKLFNCIVSDKHHVLYQLLPPERHCGYTLRPRKHELCLVNKSRLDEQNFMYRLLFKDMY